MAYDRISVIGGGAWGSALANVAARAGRAVTLWEFDAANAEHLAARRESRFLPGVRLDDAIAVTRDLGQAARADAILLVVPAQVLRSAVASLAPLIAGRTPLIACAKGIEHGTHKFMTEIIAECAPKAAPAILSGPSFAADVARGLPTAVTLAAPDAGTAAALSHLPIEAIVAASGGIARPGPLVTDALQRIPRGDGPARVLICGSLYLAGEVLKRDAT